MTKEIQSTERVLSDLDIAAIIKITREVSHEDSCRFQAVSPEDMAEAVKFYKNMNSFFDGTKRTIWNTVLVLTVGAIVGLIGVGIWHKSGGS